MKRKTRLTFNHELTFGTARPKRAGRWLFLALLFALLGVLIHTFAPQVTPRAPEAVAAPPGPEAPKAMPSAAAAPEEPSGTKVDVVVQRNDSLERIFRELKLSAADLNTILNVPGVRRGFGQLKPGDKLTVIHDGPVLQAINRHVSETEVLSVTRGESGFAAERIMTLDETEPAPMRGGGRNS